MEPPARIELACGMIRTVLSFLRCSYCAKNRIRSVRRSSSVTRGVKLASSRIQRPCLIADAKRDEGLTTFFISLEFSATNLP